MSWWREILRVEAGNIVLVLLAGVLLHYHADDRLVSAAVGGLLLRMQVSRYIRKQ